MMKGISLWVCIFLSLFFVCIDPLCEEQEVTHQLIEILGGVFPNSDLKANTYFEARINYNPYLSTSLLVDIKDFSSRDFTEPDENETLEIINRDNKTLIDLKLIEYIFTPLNTKSLTIQIKPGIVCDYVVTEISYLYQDIWEDNFGEYQVYLETERAMTHTLLPMVSTYVDFIFSSSASFSLGIDILPFGMDWIDFSEYDTTTDPVTAEQEQPFYQGKFDSFFTSYGLGLHLSLVLPFGSSGEMKLDIAGLYKQGESQNYGKYWDEIEEEFFSETYVSFEQRLNIRSNLFYALDFIKIRDIIPVLKVGYEIRIIIQDYEVDEDLITSQFDFGIAFKY